MKKPQPPSPNLISYTHFFRTGFNCTNFYTHFIHCH
ncbi:hypothetical protein GBAR_LOCUS591 [Geodia barretti]|uniref:Uncharacterized protein n=1 Tax=Geodia barretti TaxID=519541 RepID=A0AA35QT14_GEOBA|nr:hypothetical protein GBAR_LOCUS591 [Geodia barretti]